MPVWRDTVLFLAGLCGIGYETIVEHTDRPYLLILFAGMVGLPAFLRNDELRLPWMLERRKGEKGGKQ